MSTTSTGQHAETAAAEYLQQRGYDIIGRNWKTRMCEIDIIAQRDNCMYFVEVKYRATNRQGGGLEYVTPKKLQQMSFAAESWCHAHGWRHERQLAAIEVSGPDFIVGELIADLY